MNDIVKPRIARRDGFRLKKKAEMNVEKIGVVLTRTAAFRIVVSFTADMKNMKCKPRKKLRKTRSLKFLLTRLKLKDVLTKSNITPRTRQATVKRQKAIENESKFCRNLMKMAAVPNRTPAVMPSVRANFLVFTRT
jgi:hypothetical protein